VASESVIRLARVLPISKGPELVIVYDLNDYPVSARCSTCGAVMPQRQKWITSAAENLE
jgi:exosome complex RNA-binding protein Csl4